MSGCCLACHFRREEQEILPLLPSVIRDRALREHARIREIWGAGRLPVAALQAHAAWEDEVFPLYLPSKLAAEIAAEHVAIEALLDRLNPG